MTELQILMVERACEKLVTLYTHGVDFGKRGALLKSFQSMVSGRWVTFAWRAEVPFVRGFKIGRRC